MTSRTPAAGRLAAALLLVLAGACGPERSAAPAGPAPAATPASVPAPAGAAPAAAPVAAADGAAPSRVRIPAIGVDAPVVPLGLDSAGALEVPQDFAVTGWYADGPEPGEAGPAVVAGHVDSRAGPAVFFRLGELRPGDEVAVDRADGSTVTFAVRRLEQHPKDAFPSQAVYGATDEVALRLITCGGEFDRPSGHYRDNVVVFAASTG